MLGNKGICMCVGIEKEMFNNLNFLTKNYLRKKCSQEIKQTFGGSYKYEKERVKLFGFKTPNEYKNELARLKGFKTRWYEEKKNILKKYKNLKEYFNNQARKKGFKNSKDYKDFFAKNLGFKDFKDYQKFRYRELKKFRIENNLCVRCGNKRDSKFRLCLKCREYFR